MHFAVRIPLQYPPESIDFAVLDNVKRLVPAESFTGRL
jgi:hypothetical protein